MVSDVIYPLLIVAACGVFMVVVHVATRPRPSRADIAPPAATSSDGDEGAGGGGDEYSELAIDLSALERWHIANEGTVLSFLESVDDLIGQGARIDAAEESDTALDEHLLERLTRAADEHPAPDMGSELAAMASAASAMVEARERDDEAADERHRFIYLTYRRPWIERLDQFGLDRQRIRDASRRDPRRNAR